MSERIYLFLIGSIILFALYFEIDKVIYARVVLRNRKTEKLNYRCKITKENLK